MGNHSSVTFLGENNMGKIYVFRTSKGETEIQLEKVESQDFIPKVKYIPVLEGKDVEMKRESTWNERYFLDGVDVSERKQEFEWTKIDETGQRKKCSMAGSDNITAVKEIPYTKIGKTLVEKSLYLMKPWAGRQKDVTGKPNAVAKRNQFLYEEGLRFAREGIAGIGSFTWGI